MGIIGNKTLLHKLPLNQIGGAFASDIATKQNWHVKENASKLASVPNGYYAGGAWILPQTRGNISAINSYIGENISIANLAGGINITGAHLGINEATGAMDLIVSVSGSSIGSNESEGFLEGLLELIANAQGSNNLIGLMFADAFMLGNANGINLSNINNGAAQGFISGNTLTVSELSPEKLASSVWSALASQHNQSGTMGEKLNGAGSAGNPWTEIIEGTYTAADLMRILASVASGKTTITDNGNNTATVIFRDLNDTLDRVVVEMEGSERKNIEL